MDKKAKMLFEKEKDNFAKCSRSPNQCLPIQNMTGCCIYSKEDKVFKALGTNYDCEEKKNPLYYNANINDQAVCDAAAKLIKNIDDEANHKPPKSGKKAGSFPPIITQKGNDYCCLDNSNILLDMRDINSCMGIVVKDNAKIGSKATANTKKDILVFDDEVCAKMKNIPEKNKKSFSQDVQNDERILKRFTEKEVMALASKITKGPNGWHFKSNRLMK